MIPLVMVWLYLAIIISVAQWPDKIAMIVTFALSGTIPLFLLFRILTGERNRRRQLHSRESPGASVQGGVGDVNHKHSGED